MIPYEQYTILSAEPTRCHLRSPRKLGKQTSVRTSDFIGALEDTFSPTPPSRTAYGRMTGADTHGKEKGPGRAYEYSTTTKASNTGGGDGRPVPRFRRRCSHEG